MGRPRHEVSTSDQAALAEAAQAEREARARWDASLVELQQAIRQASKNGASLRAIAAMISRSHGRVSEILQGRKR
jgi:hypothetical protein